MTRDARPALVISGGATAGAVHVGGTFYLDRAGITTEHFSRITGTSIGGLVAAVLGAGQVKEGGRIFTEGHLHGTLYQRWRIALLQRPLNLHHVMHLLKAVCHLDLDRLRRSPIPIEVTITSCKTGQTRCVDLRYEKDIYILLTITAALPLVHGPVWWDNEWYMDGGMGEEIPIDHVLTHAAHAIVMLAWPRTERAEHPPHWMVRLAFPWPWQHVARRTLYTVHERYNASIAKLIEEEERGRVTIVAPDRLVIGGEPFLENHFDTRPDRIMRAVRHGYRTARRALRNHPLLVAT